MQKACTTCTLFSPFVRIFLSARWSLSRLWCRFSRKFALTVLTRTCVLRTPQLFFEVTFIIIFPCIFADYPLRFYKKSVCFFDLLDYFRAKCPSQRPKKSQKIKKTRGLFGRNGFVASGAMHHRGFWHAIGRVCRLIGVMTDTFLKKHGNTRTRVRMYHKKSCLATCWKNMGTSFFKNTNYSQIMP